MEVFNTKFYNHSQWLVFSYRHDSIQQYCDCDYIFCHGSTFV